MRVRETLANVRETNVVEIVRVLALKELFVATVEFFLSMMLVLSFFQYTESANRDKEELAYVYTTAWGPFVCGLYVAYGHRIKCLPYMPSPEHFERNVLMGKFITWIYSFMYLVWDDGMEIKSGPGLEVAIIFCVVDVLRFEMELYNLIDEEPMDEESADDDDELLKDGSPEFPQVAGPHLQTPTKGHTEDDDGIDAYRHSDYDYVRVVDSADVKAYPAANGTTAITKPDDVTPPV